MNEQALLFDYTNWLLERPGWRSEPEATALRFLEVRGLENSLEDTTDAPRRPIEPPRSDLDPLVALLYSPDLIEAVARRMWTNHGNGVLDWDELSVHYQNYRKILAGAAVDAILERLGLEEA